MTHDRKDERINIGAGMVPTYHATESVEEAKAVVESCWPATTELRRLLDKRGVEYETYDDMPFYVPATFCVDYNGDRCSALECVEATNGGGTLDVCMVMTPEQAIAATLGAGTCFPTLDSERDDLPYLDPRFVCSECGCQLTESRLGRIWQNYCPNCGCRIRIGGGLMANEQGYCHMEQE